MEKVFTFAVVVSSNETLETVEEQIKQALADEVKGEYMARVTVGSIDKELEALRLQHIEYNIERLTNGELDRNADQYPTVREEAEAVLDFEPLSDVENVIYESGQREILSSLCRHFED